MKSTIIPPVETDSQFDGGGDVVVCICEAVTDRTIRAVISDGASTVDAVGDKCKAGTCCRVCRAEIGDMIRATKAPGSVTVCLQPVDRRMAAK